MGIAVHTFFVRGMLKGLESGKRVWSLVPFIGGIIILYATLKDSEAGSNDYGDSPKYPEIDYENNEESE